MKVLSCSTLSYPKSPCSTLSYSTALCLSITFMGLTACNNNDAISPANTNEQSASSTTANDGGEQHYLTGYALDTSSIPSDAPTYRIALESNYAPYTFSDELGHVSGFDVDIIKAIGINQGFQVQLIPAKWETIFTNLDAGQYDVVVSGVSHTPEREQAYSLTKPYAYSFDTIMTKADNTGINGLSDLLTATVAVQADSFYHHMLMDMPGKDSETIKPVKTAFVGYQSVANGNADATIADSGVLHFMNNQYPEVQMRFIKDNALSKAALVMVLKKDNQELTNTINQGISAIVADGTYGKIYEYWFQTQPEEMPQ